MDGFVDLIEAVDREQQVVHLVDLDRRVQNFVKDEGPHLAATVEPRSSIRRWS